jgi:5,10-methylenetetrahydromethanopterin reductase
VTDVHAPSNQASPMGAPGLLLWSDLAPREFIETVEFADSSGYAELWYTDIRFERDVYMGLALAAQHSRRILLGPGVSDPYTRHPVTIAAAIATLHELSDGRAQVGLGTGANLEKIHLPNLDRPVRALREGIELIRALLTGDKVEYRGELYQLDSSKISFLSMTGPVPIFVATHSPQVLGLSGRLADGILLANTARPTAIDNAVQIVRDAEASSGRERGSVAIHLRLETCISDDVQRALNIMRNRVAARLITTFPQWEYLTELGIESTETMRAAATNRDAGSLAAELSDQDVRSTVLVGSVTDVISQVRSLVHPEIVRITIRPLAAPGNPLITTIRHFINDVWPAIRVGAQA